MAIPVNIEDLLNKRKFESERIEFKKGWNPDTIYHSICAFANDIEDIGGGYILVGVEEENGVAKRPVLGVAEEQLDKIQKDMVGFNNKIDPYYAPRTEVVEVDGKQIFAIWAPAGVDRPYCVPENVTSKKSPNKWYVRQGSSSVAAKGALLDEVSNLANKNPFDERPNPQIDINDISPVLVSDYLRRIKSKLAPTVSGSNLSSILEQMNLYTGPAERRYLKNVAAMMFCECPDKYFPYTQIDVVIFPEGKINNPNNFTERTFKGGVPWMIWDALNYIKTMIIEEHVVKQSGQAEALRFFNYPYDAIEEALVNSMYHRAYDEYEPVEVTIEPHRISILSVPGPNRAISDKAFNEGMDMRNRRYRNRTLGDFLKELDLTEGRSTGVPTIQEKLASNGSPKATFETDADRTTFLIDIPCHEMALSDLPKKIKRTTKSTTKSATENDKVDDKDNTLTTSILNSGLNPDDKESDKVNDYVDDQVSDQVNNPYSMKMLAYCLTPKSSAEILAYVGLKKHHDNINKYLMPLIEYGLLARTRPDVPKSRLQQYYTTTKGKEFYNTHI